MPRKESKSSWWDSRPGLSALADRSAPLLSAISVLALVALCLAVGSGAWQLGHAQEAVKRPPASKNKKATASKSKGPAAPAKGAAEKPDVVAVVNGEPISRNDLARESLRVYGEEVLEHVLNKHLISEHCRQRGITITKEDVQGEIDRMAQRFGLPTDQWLKLLEEERNITANQYANDIIWPTVALRELAAERLEVTDRDVQAAYETYYGPSVQTRLIACKSAEQARKVRAAAMKKPDSFGELAKQYSQDASASAKGLIQPIRRHLGDQGIEQAAFAMKPGQISSIIQVGEQFVILKCESILAGQEVPLGQVEQVLRDSSRDKKLRLAAENVFKQLQNASQVENVFNDPAKRAAQPGVAAVINGRKISVRELAEECIERHGLEVLDGMISRRLLEQACRKGNVTVTQQDMHDEIARAAVSMGKLTADRQPDIEAWLKEVTEEQEMSLDMYQHDVVWPTAALKKLVGGTVEISEEDLQKGYEANFGPRVRCRAIVLSQQRRAQEVWAKARDNPTVEYFGDLAEQYSVESGSRVMRGEVPPIQRHGGQPLLEKEAFALKEGELSGVIQLGDKYVILLCEGWTEPVATEFNEVKDEIYQDLHEKKLRLAMADEFTRIEDSAQVDNYLANTSRSPAKEKASQGAARPGAAQPAAVPLRERPATSNKPKTGTTKR